MRTNVVTLVVIFALGVALLFAAFNVVWTPVAIVGGVLAAVGWMGLVAARLQLGASFSVRAKARKLVTTGIYSKIRNPIYVFSWIFLLGLLIVSRRWLLLIPLTVLIPVQIGRARKEQKVLEEAFGDEYVRYKAGTWF
jgi:protein-S-isoprenylcysteine O-methyltransferase Ste14